MGANQLLDLLTWGLMGMVATAGLIYSVYRLIRWHSELQVRRLARIPLDLDLEKSIEYRARWLGVRAQAVHAEEPHLPIQNAESKFGLAAGSEPRLGEVLPNPSPPREQPVESTEPRTVWPRLPRTSVMDTLSPRLDALIALKETFWARRGDATALAWSLLERTTEEAGQAMTRLSLLWAQQAGPALLRTAQEAERLAEQLGELWTSQAKRVFQELLAARFARGREQSVAGVEASTVKDAVVATDTPQDIKEQTIERWSVEELIRAGERAVVTGNREVANRWFTLACKVDPRSEEAWLWRAALALSVEERMEALQRVLAINPANRRAENALRRTLAEHWGPALDVEEVHRAGGATLADEAIAGRNGFLEQGRAALEVGDEELAHRCFVQATQIYPENEEAWLWRARVAMDLDELVSCLEQALAINPDNQATRRNLEWARQRLDRTEPPSRQDRLKALPREVSSSSSYRRPVAILVGFVDGLAAALAIGLGLYWLSPGFLAGLLDALPGMAGFQPDLVAVVENLARQGLTLAPRLQLRDAAEDLSLWPGFGPNVWMPYMLGYFDAFAGLRLLRGQPRGRFWGLAAALATGGLALIATPGEQAVAPIGSLAIALGILLGVAWVMERWVGANALGR